MRLYWEWDTTALDDNIDVIADKFESVCHKLFPTGTVVKIWMHIPSDYGRHKVLDAMSTMEEEPRKPKFSYDELRGMYSRGTFISTGNNG